MKIGLGNEGLTINSKKISPYNFSYKGMEIEVVKTVKKQDALAMIDGLAALKNTNEEVTNFQKVKTLQSILNRNI